MARVRNLKHTEIVSKLNVQLEHLKQRVSRLSEKHELEMGMEIKARKEEALSHVENINALQNLTKMRLNGSESNIPNMYRGYRKKWYDRNNMKAKLI